MLLVHHVAAGYHTVVVDDERTVATLADRADGTLWYATGIVGIAELKERLLLHIVAEHTLVGDRHPHVLVLVDIDDGRYGLNTHTGKSLLHVTLKRLRLWMIDAVAGSSINPQCTVKCFLNGVDVTVGQREAVLRVALEIGEGMTVETI